MPAKLTTSSKEVRVHNGTDKVATVRRVSQRRASQALAPVNGKAASGSGSTSDWIGEIIQVWSRGSGHAMELARVIGRARSRLPHGQWGHVLKSLPFSKRKADMLATVGKRLTWLNGQTFAHLPTGWSILYQLAQLERVAFEQSLRQGTIHPKLTLREARELVIQFNGGPKKNPSLETSVKRRLQLFRKYVQRSLPDWKLEDREMATTALALLIQQIDGSHLNQASEHVFTSDHLIVACFLP